ncbi:Ccdc189 [Symbiodinium natans]|uniref:Ccdc189 protein n=1 Tax=Symbiodinium natans TaxID=878477 RepID=A0A812T296_9DINO|nr:Ccdc189 [Symbiodinium natans]
MAPKKPQVAEEPPEEEAAEPEPVEGDETELETGLKLPLRPNDVGRIWALQDHAAQSKLLAELLGLEGVHPTLARREIVCDFHLFNLSHAKMLCLNQRQAAVFHAIMSTVLDMMAGLQEGASEGSAAAECFKKFQELLIVHSVNDPPSRLAVFAGGEARRLTDYAATTLFKHFLLYQFCVRCERDMETLRFSVEVERPLAPPASGTARQKASRRPPQAAENEGPAASVEAHASRAPQEKPSGAGEDMSEEEIQRLVEEKLRETEVRLEAKLAAREQQFMERLAGK